MNHQEGLRQLRRLLIASLLIQGVMIALFVLGFSAYLDVEGYHFSRLSKGVDDVKQILSEVLHDLEGP